MTRETDDGKTETVHKLQLSLAIPGMQDRVRVEFAEEVAPSTDLMSTVGTGRDLAGGLRLGDAHDHLRAAERAGGREEGRRASSSSSAPTPARRPRTSASSSRPRARRRRPRPSSAAPSAPPRRPPRRPQRRPHSRRQVSQPPKRPDKTINATADRDEPRPVGFHPEENANMGDRTIARERHPRAQAAHPAGRPPRLLPALARLQGGRAGAGGQHDGGATALQLGGAARPGQRVCAWAICSSRRCAARSPLPSSRSARSSNCMT